MELASRDVVSRSEQTEIDEGRGVNGSILLDMRHLGAEKIIERLPGSRELSMTFAGVDPIYDPVPVRPGRALPHGRCRDRQRRRDRADRALRGGRGRVRVGARGEPARRQLADGDDHVRPPRRPRGRGVGALAHDDRRTGERRERRGARAEGDARRRTGERPWQIRKDLGTSMLENFGVFRREDQMARQIEILEELKERYDRGVVIEDKGEVFNSDLTQAIELGNMIELARCMLQAGIARKESRGAHARPHDYPDARRRELHEALDLALGRRRAGALLQRGSLHEVRADGADVLAGAVSVGEVLPVGLDLVGLPNANLDQTRLRRPSPPPARGCARRASRRPAEHGSRPSSAR